MCGEHLGVGLLTLPRDDSTPRMRGLPFLTWDDAEQVSVLDAVFNAPQHITLYLTMNPLALWPQGKNRPPCHRA